MEPDADAQPPAGEGGPTSPRDRWWFSPTLQVVAGAAVVGFQWGPITDGTANWLNWVVAGAGAVVALLGATAWVRALRER
jgi:hypothetical protein